ncbi:hypothetical protein CPB86DRAFT_220247 [Serendipita vermifera]|nr:hypothetical protein CPB86DRAFT_220247 [Serendipita vermifera]
MADEESSNASSGDLSSELSEEYRSIRIYPLNVSGPPPSAEILDLTQNIAYSDISNQIARQLGRPDGDITLLAPTFGLRPCWKFPEENERIPHNITKLYLVDRTRPFVIALLRTDIEDQPLLVEAPSDTNHIPMTALSMLESVMKDRNLELKSAKMYEDSEKLKDQLYDYPTYLNLPSFPTVFYASSAQCVCPSHSENCIFLSCVHSRHRIYGELESSSDILTKVVSSNGNPTRKKKSLCHFAW